MGVGSSLDSKYFLQKVKLGQGSFGTVWRGVNKSSGEVVAVKQMDKMQLPRRGVKRADIEREVSVMQAMSHCNILRLLDFYEDNTHISFVLEYCDGGDFGDKVKERASNLTEPEAAEWMRQMCDAILHMHNKEYCHRDIKPDNFMITLQNQLKLADFGLAITCARGKLLTEKCGTPAFMAPEQHQLPGKSRGYGFPADMWAAGITMFMLMAGGRHPFVDGRNQLDTARLQQGALDFSGGIFGFAMSRSRFSESARELCRRMVEPSQSKRITAQDALKDEWLRLADGAKFPEGPTTGREKTALEQPPKVERVKSAPEPGVLRDGQSEKGQPSLRRSRTDQNHGESKANNNWLGMGMGNWLLGIPEDENAGPNVPKDADEEAQQRKIALLSTQQQKLSQDVGLHKENLQLRQQLEEVQRMLEREQAQAAKLKRRSAEAAAQRRSQQASNQKQASGYPQDIRSSQRYTTERDFSRPEPVPNMDASYAARSGINGTARNGIERRSTKEMGALSLNQGPAGSRLPSGIKCRYNSSSYPGWLNAVVENCEDDGTISLDIRAHAKVENISPCPDVTVEEAWPPGTWVSYNSSTANRWLPAVVVSFNVGGGGLRGTYNLDLRECAEVDRVRPRRTTPTDM